MDAKNVPKFNLLIDTLQEEKSKAAETAEQFPESVEAYLALPPTARMTVARGLLYVYTKDPEMPHFHVQEVNYPVDETTSVVARVYAERPTRRIIDPPEITVGAVAKDTSTDIKGHMQLLGGIAFEVDKPKVKIYPRNDNHPYIEFLPEDDGARPIIEIVDDAIVQLLTEKVFKHRKLGETALTKE